METPSQYISGFPRAGLRAQEGVHLQAAQRVADEHHRISAVCRACLYDEGLQLGKVGGVAARRIAKVVRRAAQRGVAHVPGVDQCPHHRNPHHRGGVARDGRVQVLKARRTSKYGDARIDARLVLGQTGRGVQDKLHVVTPAGELDRV
eukprot:CAMPEP_0180048110 /NCGR_PEP_ID=MMETSP0984-20121128/38131_1 /TAXON_ID=483367 /ORGANISM="non described non described, Strain CCMP 2436" /LENGTH=147 /DNA_ID=CAMNT_0021977021 /DNA_START=493 /DNA_END=935 /DNA_ORIENTATION=+